jgi:hypothetical protein
MANNTSIPSPSRGGKNTVWWLIALLIIALLVWWFVALPAMR